VLPCALRGWTCPWREPRPFSNDAVLVDACPRDAPEKPLLSNCENGVVDCVVHFPSNVNITELAFGKALDAFVARN